MSQIFIIFTPQSLNNLFIYLGNHLEAKSSLKVDGNEKRGGSGRT
jgi:hypothetical protein